MEYFDEKAVQISEESMTAFGIPITTRYGKAIEMQEMLHFTRLVAAGGLHGLVKDVFYDSKADLCTIEMVDESTFNSPAGQRIREAALTAIRQFQWDGTILHGASLRDRDSDF